MAPPPTALLLHRRSVFNDFIVKHYPLQLLGQLISLPNAFIGVFCLLLYLAVWLSQGGHIQAVVLGLSVLICALWVVPVYMWRYRAARLRAAGGSVQHVRF